MSSYRPRFKKPHTVRVPRLVADGLVRRGERAGYLKARQLPFLRRLRVALRIVRGLTRDEREGLRLVEAARAGERPDPTFDDVRVSADTPPAP